MPTPEEMRAASAAAAEKNRREARAESRQKAKKHRELLERNMSRKDEFIRTVEGGMSRAGSSTKVRVKVNTDPRWSTRDNWKPTLQAVVDYFTDQGYKAEYEFDNQTEYYGDGAGPGEDWQYIIVDWTPDA